MSPHFFHFEHHKKPVVSRFIFLSRLAKSFLLGMLFILLSLFIGMLGYHYFENMPWIDAYVNAAMILSGMGPLGPLSTMNGKLFAGSYALFSGIAFLLSMAVIVAPIIHRFLHKFHMQVEEEDRHSKK